MITVFAVNQIAVAQNSRLPGVIDKEPEVKKFKQELGDYLPQSSEKPELAKPSGSDEIITAHIKNIVIEGVTVFDSKALEVFKQPYLNRKLSENDLIALKFELTKLYFDHGYILVKVYTPPQDMSSGILKVSVVEGRIGKINFINEVLHPCVIGGLFRRVNINDIFHEDEVETVINDLDSLQNVKAHLRLEPGDTFGTTTLNVEAQKVDEDVQFIEYNNYGADLISRDTVSLGLEKSNLLSLGETVGIQFDYGPSNLYGGHVEWFSPIPSTDFYFNAIYALNDIKIGEPFRILDATGDSHTISGDISYNLYHTNTRRLTATVGMEYRNHRSFLLGFLETHDTITKARASLNYLHRWVNSLLFLNFEFKRGVDLFGATTETDLLATRPHNPNAWILLPTLIVQHQFSSKDQISLRLNGQYGTSRLLASDLFALGGYYSIRGFEPGQETGESGFGASFEYIRDLYKSKHVYWAVHPFVEAGAVYNRLNNASLDSHLTSAGIGFNLDFDYPKAFFGKTKLAFDFAKAVGDYQSNAHRSAYYYVSVKQEV